MPSAPVPDRGPAGCAAGRRALPVGGALLALACGGSEATPAGGSGLTLPDRFVVTADFLNRSLSVLDADLLGGATTRDDALIGVIDLAAYAPGPMQVELSADGRTALVSVGPGFFAGGGGLLIGIDPGAAHPDGTLLVVDLPTRRVREVDVGSAPMGLAISPDGTTGYSANFGAAERPEKSLSVIDLATATELLRTPTEGTPEQITLSPDGALGLVSLDGIGSIATFSTAAPGTLSPPLEVCGDPSDVAFVPGTSRAVVACSLGPAGWAVIDVSDPLAPALVELGSVNGGSPYAATSLPGTERVLVTRSLATPAELLEVELGPPTASLRTITLCNVAMNGQNPKPSFPLGAAVTADAATALVSLSGDRSLCVVDLAAGSARRIPWLEQAGPTYAAVFPVTP